MLFTCTDVGGERLLLFQMDFSCRGWGGAQSTSLNIWRIVMLICGIVYVVVLPGTKFWTLFKVRHLSKAGDEDTMRTYGFMTNGTHPEYYYWQLVIMARKLLATSLITLTKPYGVCRHNWPALCSGWPYAYKSNTSRLRNPF